MLHKYNPKPDGWISEWLKGVVGGRLLKPEDNHTQDSSEKEDGQTSDSSDSSSDDDYGMKIPIPDVPSR